MKLMISLITLFIFSVSSIAYGKKYTSDNVYALFETNRNGEKTFIGLCGDNSTGCLKKLNRQVFVENNQLIAKSGEETIVIGTIDDRPTKLAALSLYFHTETYLVKMTDFKVKFKSKLRIGFLPIHSSMYQEDKFFCAPLPPGMMILFALSQGLSNWKKVRKLDHQIIFTGKNREIKLQGKAKRHGKFYFKFSSLTNFSTIQL